MLTIKKMESKNKKNTGRIITLYDDEDEVKINNDLDEIRTKPTVELNKNVGCVFKLEPKLDLEANRSNIIICGQTRSGKTLLV